MRGHSKIMWGAELLPRVEVCHGRVVSRAGGVTSGRCRVSGTARRPGAEFFLAYQPPRKGGRLAAAGQLLVGRFYGCVLRRPLSATTIYRHRPVLGAYRRSPCTSPRAPAGSLALKRANWRVL